MKIAVLGAGAMGCLFAARLSACHDVTVIGRNAARMESVRAEGIRVIEKDGSVLRGAPAAALPGDALGVCDLVLVFVKAMATEAALEGIRSAIGPDTLLLTLQNGVGHEDVLSRFAPMENVLVGTTQHNASVREDGSIYHGGSGVTVIGSLVGNNRAAEAVARAFEQAGFDMQASRDVRRAVWQKLMTNASLSALTGVFQMPMGFVTGSESAWTLCRMLIREAVAVAAADGVVFDAEEKIEEVRKVGVNGPMGITSICADLMHGRVTEVDTISGSVVRAARRLGLEAPHHEMMVLLIHAFEDKNKALAD